MDPTPLDSDIVFVIIHLTHEALSKKLALVLSKTKFQSQLRTAIQSVLKQGSNFEKINIVLKLNGKDKTYTLKAIPIKAISFSLNKHYSLIRLKEVTKGITKEINDQLKKSFDYVQSISDTVPLPLVVLDHKFCLQSANQAFYKQFHVSPRALGGDFFSVMGESQENMIELRQAISAVFSGNKIFTHFELNHRFLKLGHKTMLFSAKKIRWIGKETEATLIAIEDVTERKQMEQSFRRESARAQLLEAVAVAANESPDLNSAIQIFLDRICVHTGWPIGHSYLSLNGYFTSSHIWHLADSHLFSNFKNGIESLKVVQGIGLLGMIASTRKPAWVIDITQDPNFIGTELAKEAGLKSFFAIPVMVGQKVAAMLEFYTTQTVEPDRQLLDIMGHIGFQLGRVIERKKAEDTLKRSLQQFETLTTLSPVGILLTDTQGNCVYVNEKWRRLAGLSTEKAAGPNWMQALHPDDRERVSQEWYSAVKEGKEFASEFRFQTPDKAVSWLSGRATSLCDETGKITAYLGTVTDITERKYAEEERTRLLQREQLARTEAEQANRAKDLFLATLSHELRTPLTSILSWIQMLRMGRLDPEKSKRGLEIIEQSAKTQAQLINDLLDVSRIQAGKFPLERQDIDPTAVIRAAMESVGPAAEEKEIQIETKLDSSVGVIFGDASRLQQVIWNLLANAIKFSSTGGRIELRLERFEEQGRDSARIQVRDQGKGINPEFLPYIFNLFTQADSSTTRAYGGLGLGLAIVRNLVELHGGTVQAESPGEGKGATFTVNLPLKSLQKGSDLITQPKELSRKVTEGEEGVRLDGLRILIVDDEASAREAFTFMLGSFGAEVQAVESASKAVEAFGQFKPHILVSDIAMPGEDGYSLMQKIRALDSTDGGQVPSIALTAYAGPEDRNRALASGFQTHVSKPVDANHLARVIERLVKPKMAA